MTGFHRGDRPRRFFHKDRRLTDRTLHFGTLLFLLALCLGLAPAAQAQVRLDLPSKRGVVQPIYLSPADHPVASAILFPGNSALESALRDNFLLRVADDFANAGITVAVADEPLDHTQGLDVGFRAGADQAIDAAAIVAYLRRRAPVPIWVIGTGRGSISAANVAMRLGSSQIMGVVLTSSVWAGGMLTVPLGKLRVPVLIVHNRDDRCLFSPFNRADEALTTLTAAPAKQLIAVDGGDLRGAPCEGQSPHGYYHIENQVVPQIIDWIRTH